MANQHELIEQFTVLLNMCKTKGVYDTLKKAREAPGLFVFGELVAHPCVQKVRYRQVTKKGTLRLP
jgi:hypothetical protein